MNISIISVCAASNGDLAIGIELSDGEISRKKRFVISIDAYTKMGIYKGECSRELYRELETEASIYSAFKRGMSIIGFCPCSQKALVSKLLAKGFVREHALEAAERIFAMGFVDDFENAKREAQKCADKLWGKTRIRACLLQKKYSSDITEKALLSLEDEGVDFDGNCKKLIAKRYPVLPKERAELQKLIASITRYGYTVSQIKAALQD